METKVCTRCEEAKPLDEFKAFAGGRNKGKLIARCVSCIREVNREGSREHYRRNPELGRQRSKQFAKNNPDYVWGLSVQRLLDKYGLTIDSYHALAERQNFLCAMCGCEPPERRTQFDNFVIDHDHKTGKVRGLLCNTCNVSLGMLKDDPDIAMKAALYLEHHHGKRKTTAPTHVAA